MQLSEHQRQAYLDAMGIQVWFPRVELPHALPARDLEGFINEVAQPEAVCKPQHSTEAASGLSLPAATPTKPLRSADILSRVGISEPAATTHKKQTPATHHGTTVIPDPAFSHISQFRLVVIPLGEDHLTVTEMPYTGLNQFTRYHLRLLQDMTRALKLPSPEQHSREFLWPLATGPAHGSLLSQVNQDDRVAADALAAFLQNQFGLYRQRTLLLLGPSAARFVIDPTQSFDTLRGVQTGLCETQQVAVTHSLDKLMKVPSLKAEAWADLQPLLSR